MFIVICCCSHIDTSTNRIIAFKAEGALLLKDISIAGVQGEVGICIDPEGRITVKMSHR